MSNIDKNEDMSQMIKLTPTEIMNLMRDFADRWQKAKSNGTSYTLRELCKTYYDITIGVLKQTDPDRFIDLN